MKSGSELDYIDRQLVCTFSNRVSGKINNVAKQLTKSLISYDVAARPCESGPFCSTHAGRKGDAGKKYPFEVLRALRSSVDDTKFGYDLTWSDCVCTPDEYSYGCHCKRLENYTITRGVITKDDLVEQCVGHISVENGYSPLSCYFVWRLAKLVARDWHGEASEMIEPHVECDYYGEYFTGWQSFIADKIREKCRDGLPLAKLLSFEYMAQTLSTIALNLTMSFKLIRQLLQFHTKIILIDAYRQTFIPTMSVL